MLKNVSTSLKRIASKLGAIPKALIKNKTYLLIFSIGLALLVFGLYLLVDKPFEAARSSKDNQPRVVGIGDVPTNAYDQFGNSDAKKPSSVCKAISKQKVTGVIGETVDKQHPSIPDTNTKEGSVAGCSYVVAQTDNQTIRSIQIVQRKITDQNKASDVYSSLTKTDKAKLLNIEGAKAVQITNQAIVLKDGILTTIVINSINDKKVNTDTLKSLVYML